MKPFTRQREDKNGSEIMKRGDENKIENKLDVKKAVISCYHASSGQRTAVGRLQDKGKVQGITKLLLRDQ